MADKVVTVGDDLTLPSSVIVPAARIDAAAAVEALLAASDAAGARAGIGAGDMSAATVGYVTPTSMSYADLQTAASTAASTGRRLVASGTLTTDQTLTLTSDADLSALTINYTGTGIAVRVGNGSAVLRRKRIVLPSIIEGNKPTTGWTAGTVGARLDTLSDCKVTLNNVQDFETGVLCYGSGAEFSYNEISVHGLNNNKVNLKLDGDATGWCNANTFIGGRYSHNSGEGTQVSGVCHILLADITISRPNGNVWLGASLESPNVVQYHLNVESGQYNQWIGCRWEDTSGSARVRWGAKALQNMIVGGFFADQINATRVSGSLRNMLSTADRWEMDGAGNPVMRLENSGSSAQGAIAIYNAGTISNSTPYSPTADWSMLLSASQFRMKGKADGNDRFQIDYTNRRITLGAGINASAVTVTWGTGSPEGVVAANVGSVYYNYGAASTGFGRYVKGSGTGNTGWHSDGFQPFATASRPAASLAGSGGSYFDITLGKPVWSTGSAWVDATGAAV